MIFFVDLNSFFATCEQQVNYWLRGRPVGVCVYTNRTGFVIAPSIEAKQFGVKLGMRLPEAMQLCPELVPVETHPARYRDFHNAFIATLRSFAEEKDVLPRSIDEAVVDFTHYTHMQNPLYRNPPALAQAIKQAIKEKVGDWIKCSVGIAPNALLAKLGSDLRKPEGLVYITPENLDSILADLELEDLPGIAQGMARRLRKGGVNTPLQLRYTPANELHRICQSIVGDYWHARLNFGEVDLSIQPQYASMQAMRQIAAQQREAPEELQGLFVALIHKLERRMMQHGVYCRAAGISFTYQRRYSWRAQFRFHRPQQSAAALLRLFQKRMAAEAERRGSSLFTTELTAIGVTVTDFVPADLLQIDLFEDNVRDDRLRRTIYTMKERFGNYSLLKGIELKYGVQLADVIGFGSIKDLNFDNLQHTADQLVVAGQGQP